MPSSRRTLPCQSHLFSGPSSCEPLCLKFAVRMASWPPPDQASLSVAGKRICASLSSVNVNAAAVAERPAITDGPAIDTTKTPKQLGFTMPGQTISFHFIYQRVSASSHCSLDGEQPLEPLTAFACFTLSSLITLNAPESAYFVKLFDVVPMCSADCVKSLRSMLQSDSLVLFVVMQANLSPMWAAGWAGQRARTHSTCGVKAESLPARLMPVWPGAAPAYQSLTPHHGFSLGCVF